jgi:hypothetical protein
MEHPRLRLLHCHDCGTLDEIRPPDNDGLLEIVMSKHETNGLRHIGKLYDVEERLWALPNARYRLIEQIKGGGSSGLQVIDPKFYESRDTFKDDAMACYNAHLRPKGMCPDYRSKRKILRPDTKEERKDAGLRSPREGLAPITYLCQFCPVDSWVKAKERGDVV